jgi:hypothetical protein
VPPFPKPSDWAVNEIFGESRYERIALTTQPNFLGYVVIVRDTTVAMKNVLFSIVGFCSLRQYEGVMSRTKDTTVYRITTYLRGHSNSHCSMRQLSGA